MLYEFGYSLILILLSLSVVTTYLSPFVVSWNCGILLIAYISKHIISCQQLLKKNHNFHSSTFLYSFKNNKQIKQLRKINWNVLLCTPAGEANGERKGQKKPWLVKMMFKDIYVYLYSMYISPYVLNWKYVTVNFI